MFSFKIISLKYKTLNNNFKRTILWHMTFKKIDAWQCGLNMDQFIIILVFSIIQGNFVFLVFFKRVSFTVQMAIANFKCVNF